MDQIPLDLVNLLPILGAERGVVGPAHVIAPFIQCCFLSRILLQGELLAKQKEIIIQMELADRMLENKKLAYI